MQVIIIRMYCSICVYEQTARKSDTTCEITDPHKVTHAQKQKPPRIVENSESEDEVPVNAWTKNLRDLHVS
jgi:hypothetical protein